MNTAQKTTSKSIRITRNGLLLFYALQSLQAQLHCMYLISLLLQWPAQPVFPTCRAAETTLPARVQSPQLEESTSQTTTMEHCAPSWLSPFKLNKSHITALKWQDLKPQFVEKPKLNMNSQWRGGMQTKGNGHHPTTRSRNANSWQWSCSSGTIPN